MIAADLMTNPVLAVGPDTPLVQAIRLMTGRRISGLPVVSSDGILVGMLTEGDLLRRVETGTDGEGPGWLARTILPGRVAADYVLTHGRRVGELMTSNVISVAEQASLSDIVSLMRRHRVKRLPVVREGRLVGVISRSDLVRALGELLAEPAVSLDDAAIRHAIETAMDRETWSSRRAVSVAVADGAVQLDGCLFGIRERDALGVLAENTPGVRSVENRTVCIEPYSGWMTYDPAGLMLPLPPRSYG